MTTAALVAAATVAAAGIATAQPPQRTTRGDAQAVLQAFPTGGWAILLHTKNAYGAPAQGLPGPVAIRPFSGTPFDGAHYCELDWHTIVVGDTEGGDKGFKRPEAEAIISTIDVTFALDGSTLAGVTRTAVKPFLNAAFFGLDVAYVAQWGKVMAPSDLAVGAHDLGVTFTINGSPIYDDAITFTIDPAGTGTCL